MDNEGPRHPLGEDQILGGVWRSDADDIVRYASEGMARIAGIPTSEIVGLRLSDDFSPDTMREFMPQYRRACETGEPLFYDRIRVITPQGRESFQSGWLIPQFDDGHRLCGVICTVRDVTEMIGTERELLASTERWRTMALLSPVGVFETDPDGDCVFVNRKWSELTGLSAERARGRGWVTALHPEDRDRVGAAWYDFSVSGEGFDHEYRFLRPDGTVVWVRGIAVATHDERGDTAGYLGVVADITERMRMTEELDAQKDRAEQCLEVADLLMVALDSTGCVVQANAKAKSLLDTDDRPLVGSAWFEIYIPEAVRGAVSAVFFSLLGQDARTVESYENPILLPDGTERTIEWHNSLVTDDAGKVTGSVSLGLDVTEARRAEIVRFESEAKDRFLANMSHELRTPLNSIIGFSGVLLNGLAGPLTDEQQRQVEMIRLSGAQMLKLVNDLLDAEQIETHGVSLALEEIDWGDLLSEIAEDARPEVERANLTFECFADASLRVAIVGDKDRVRQILANLISNAVKFTRDGTVSVGWGCSAEQVYAYVKDTGEGIAASQQESVFELYHQAPRVGVAKSRGAGLGLPLSRTYARMLGGDLSLLSEEGVGSTFTLVIPRTPDMS